MKKIFFLLLIFIFCFGCSTQLRTLISLSNEQNAQKKYVAVQKQKFNLLLNDLKRKRLHFGKEKKEKILSLYGEPIAIKEMEDKEVFVYRDPTDFFPSQKVCLFFEENGILSDFKVESVQESSQ